MIEYKHVLTPAMLFAAGSFATAAQATTHLDVDYTASNEGTLIAIGVAPADAQFKFQDVAFSSNSLKTEHHIYALGNAGIFTNLSGTSPSASDSYASEIKTGSGVGAYDGLYGIRFDIAGATQYGNFTVDSQGTHISAIDYDAAPASDVPEPAIWAEMILGFGLAGATLRRRQPRLATAA